MQGKSPGFATGLRIRWPHGAKSPGFATGLRIRWPHSISSISGLIPVSADSQSFPQGNSANQSDCDSESQIPRFGVSLLGFWQKGNSKFQNLRLGFAIRLIRRVSLRETLRFSGFGGSVRKWENQLPGINGQIVITVIIEWANRYYFYDFRTLNDLL